MKDAERLRFILEKVRTLGFVSLDDVKSKFPDRTKSTTWLERDKEVITSLGLPIRITEKHFISTEPGTRRRTYTLRKKLAKDEKEDLSRAATSLLAGHVDLAPVIKGLHSLMDELLLARIRSNRKVSQGGDDEKEVLTNVKKMAQRLVDTSTAASNIQDVTESWAAKNLDRFVTNVKGVRSARSERNIPQLVLNYLAKSHRHILLDSGTTTEAVATDLKEQHFWSGPPYLTVYTNAPRIESVLEDSDIGVVGLMGEVRKDTSARTGFWNQRSLELLREIAIDVAVVGTTGLALEGQRIVGFACDSSDEAHTKSQMLSIAKLRTVCADGSKLARATSSAFVFADADSTTVDILITDHTAATGAKKHLTTLAKEGILVLVGGEKSDRNKLGFWDPIQQCVMP